MSRFAKNVAIMSIAPLVTQSLSFLLMPIITRLFSPDEFGQAALFGAIVMPFAIFTNMGYSSAIVVPRSDEEGTNLLAINVFFTIIVASFSTTILFIRNSSFLSWIHAEDLLGYLWLVPLSILFHGLYMSFRYWNIRNQKFGYVSAAKIFRFATENGIILLSGFMGLGSGLVLIIAGFSGGIASTTVLSRSMWKKNNQLMVANITIKRMTAVAKKYSKFPKFILFNDIISRLSDQLPIFLFSIYFSQAIIGFYALGLRLLVAPMSLLGGAIGEVFFQEASQNRQDIAEMLIKLFKYLLLVGLPVFLLLGIMGEEIFRILFGKEWSEAGIFAQILSLLILTKFITIPSSFLMLIFEKQEYSILLNVATLFVSTISLIIGGLMGNIYLTLALFSLLNSLVNIIYGFGFMKYAGLNLANILFTFSKMLIVNIPFILILIAIKLLFRDSDLISMILSCLVLVIFYTILVISSPETRKLLFLMINKGYRKIGRKQDPV
jgi:lipopolysaccharide exporter